MSLKLKLYGLMTLLHLGILVGVYWSMEQPGIEFIAIEIAVLLSYAAFIFLLKQALAPLQYLGMFKNILKEQQYTNRFSLTQSYELDQLLKLFNQMLQQLHEEHVKVGDTTGMLQKLMNSMPNAIIVFDHDNQVAQLNPAAQKLLAVNNQQMAGQPLSNIKHNIIEQLQNLPVDEPKLINDGTAKRYRCQRCNFRDKGFDRQFIIIQELTTDLQTSEKNTYQKLIRMMSHEVNNTMAATGSLLQSCLYYTDQIDQDERQDYQDAMHLVIERTNNLNQFMQDFANMVKLPAPSKELCNLHHILMSISGLFEAQAKQQQIQLSFDSIDPAQAQIMADRNQIEQVLINIIKNAIEAITDELMPKQTQGQEEKQEQEIEPEQKTKRIIIQLSQQQLNHRSTQQTKLLLQIKDSGSGITATTGQQLFTPFYTTKPQGQGLGLMLVREILSAHQLVFSLYNWCENNSQQGACFEIAFPQVKP